MFQAFYDRGSCLPTHMPPEKLCSIRTHENNPEDQNSDGQESSNDKERTAQPDGKENVEMNKKKRKLELDEKNQGEEKRKEGSQEDSTEAESEPEKLKSSKKRKTGEEVQDIVEAAGEERSPKEMKTEEGK